MKITREEFKEYVHLYQDAWDGFEQYGDIIDSNFLDGLMFPLFSWFDNKLGIKDDNIGSWVLEYITSGNKLYLYEKNEDGTIRDFCVTDLDALYDAAIKGGVHCED